MDEAQLIREIKHAFDESMYRVLPDLLVLVEDELKACFDCVTLHVDVKSPEEIRMIMHFSPSKET